MIEFKTPQEVNYLDDMTRQVLVAYLAEWQAELEELDTQEPTRMGSEAYEAWADEHEELEDAMDEVRELLDEMGD